MWFWVLTKPIANRRWSARDEMDFAKEFGKPIIAITRRKRDRKHSSAERGEADLPDMPATSVPRLTQSTQSRLHEVRHRTPLFGWHGMSLKT